MSLQFHEIFSKMKKLSRKIIKSFARNWFQSKSEQAEAPLKPQKLSGHSVIKSRLDSLACQHMKLEIIYDNSSLADIASLCS